MISSHSHLRPLVVLFTCSLALAAVLIPNPAAGAGRIESLELKPNPPHPGDIIEVSGLMPVGAKDFKILYRGVEHRGVIKGGIFHCLVGIDLGVEPGEAEMHIYAGTEKVPVKFEITPKKFGSESLTVKSSYTNLSKGDLARVGSEKTLLTDLWKTVTPARLWRSSFVKPAVGAMGSPFGLRRLFNGQPRSPHSGVDIKAPTGTKVVASNRGRVVVAEDLFFTGNTVVIDHGMGLYTIYAHLSELAVEEGDAVGRSQEIGKVGATGRVTGPHLHWAAKLMGARVDPEGLPGRRREAASAGQAPTPGS